MGLKDYRRIGSIMLISVLSQTTALADLPERLGGMVGAGVGIGQLGGADADLSNRWMSALSVDSLLGYSTGRSIFGLHLDYRTQGQLSSLENSGGTNAKGQGYLLGLGAAYRWTESLHSLVAIDFHGQYDFSNHTHAGEEDDMRSPIGLRIKAGYFFNQDTPISLDADLQYLRYRQVRISNVDSDWAVDQWIAGVALTYHFGKFEPTSAVASVPRNPAMVPKSDLITELSKVAKVEIVNGSLKLILEGHDSFEANSVELSEQAKAAFAAAAKVLAKFPGHQIRVEGHSDTSGNFQRNIMLSRGRAETLRDLFVQNGVAAINVNAQEFGSTRPMADNENKEGRAANRRVEIYVDQNPQEVNQ